MSQADTPSFLAGSVGTIVITPGTDAKVYPNQGLYIVATITMTGGDTIPEGAAIDFSGSGNGISAHFQTLFGEPDKNAVPIAIDVSGKTGTAKLCIHHDYSDTGNTIVVNAKANRGTWTSPTPDDAATVTYTLQAIDPVIMCTGASKTLLGIPDADDLTPSATAYTTSFTCSVMDGATPVAGYVIEWHEGTTRPLGLFAESNQGLVNAYTSAAATYADALPSKDAVFIEDQKQDGHFVRTVTDANGIASLYLVAKNNSESALSPSIQALYDFNVTWEYPRAFLILSTKAENIDAYVKVEDERDKGTVDYGQLIDPPYVTVTIPNFKSSHPADDVYLVLNNAIVGGPYHYKDASSDLSCTFLASLAYSNFGGKQKNEILFVVGHEGVAKASDTAGFYGKGDNIQLSGGPLDKPKLSPEAAYINQTTLNRGSVAIMVDLVKQPRSGWSANVGDVIGATAVLTGYVPDSDQLRVPLSVNANVLPPISQDDIAKGYVLLHFPLDPFKGWDSSETYDYDGHCCIVYTVMRRGQADQSSAVLSVVLNTANSSFVTDQTSNLHAKK